MNSKKLINSEYGLSHQGLGLSQQMEYEIFLFDSFLDAKGGNGGSGGKKGGNPLDPTPSDPSDSDTYLSGSKNDDGTPYTADDADEYNIQINFEGGMWETTDEGGDTIDLSAAFKTVADFLSKVITSDVFTGGTLPDSYDGIDLTINASIVEIDTEGGILGQAGPTHIWNPDLTSDNDVFTSQAIMQFDSADAVALYEVGLWDEVILHEMIHCLGLGTLWDYTGLVTSVFDDNGTKKPTDDTFLFYDYNGDLANYTSAVLFDEYADSFENYITAFNINQDYLKEGDPSYDKDFPVADIEEDGGSGTAGGHWDEMTYDNELMTGWINLPLDEDTPYYSEVTGKTGNFLSEMTYAGLADLGYDISTTYLPSTYLPTEDLIIA